MCREGHLAGVAHVGHEGLLGGLGRFEAAPAVAALVLGAQLLRVELRVAVGALDEGVLVGRVLALAAARRARGLEPLCVGEEEGGFVSQGGGAAGDSIPLRMLKDRGIPWPTFMESEVRNEPKKRENVGQTEGKKTRHE